MNYDKAVEKVREANDAGEYIIDLECDSGDVSLDGTFDVDTLEAIIYLMRNED
tara:strand:- start:112 stop:270 length:159 start_codon:yes stop_codon:yes gene_type:complete